ncbi:tRNA (adenosine(37)-N6)-threonylcarbamoyltransferase complex dimerization subunit type 1 TsaB [Patescibacteria group bacterium]
MFLIIDTSASKTLIALADAKKVIDSEIWEAGRNLSIDLLPKIDALLEKNAISGEELESLVVLSGPGSYTGLRIGVTLVNALGFAWKISVKGVNRFEAWENFYDIKAAAGESIILDADHEKIFMRLSKVAPENSFWIGLPHENSEIIEKFYKIYTDLSEEAVKNIRSINSSAEILNVSREEQDVLESIRLAALKQKDMKNFEAVQPLYIRPPAITPKKDVPKHK